MLITISIFFIYYIYKRLQYSKHRPRWLAGDIVDDAGAARDLVDDAPRAVVQELVGQVRPARGHEVDDLHRAQLDDVVVAAVTPTDFSRNTASDQKGLNRLA